MSFRKTPSAVNVVRITHGGKPKIDTFYCSGDAPSCSRSDNIFYTVVIFNAGIFHVLQVHQRSSVMLWKFSAIMVQFLWLVKRSIYLLLCCLEENFVTLPWDPEDSCCLLIPVMKCREQINKSSSIQEWFERGRNYIWPLLKILFCQKLDITDPLRIMVWERHLHTNKLPAVLFTSLGFDLDSGVLTIWVSLHIIPSKTANLNGIYRGLGEIGSAATLGCPWVEII